MAAQQQSRLIFVNLAVEDLGRAADFFTQLGFTFDERFTDEAATCIVLNDQAFVMLLTRNRFKDFTKREVADPTKATEAILALSAESREGVDELADKALAAGGQQANDPIDMGFMYSRASTTRTATSWEVLSMDPAQLEQ